MGSEKTPKEIARERAGEMIGRVISDRYRIDEVLAVGGMGCVYRGSHVHMRKRVAIKLLLPETEGLPELVARFQREAVAGAHINHPNVAAATDFGKLEDGTRFLILEYVNGVTLHDLIKQGPMHPVRAVRIARQLASALDAAHQKGVIHRDLKPRNVMVDEAERDLVKLIDFGLAKVPIESVATAEASATSSKAAPHITAVGVVLGTVAYMAPEAAFGMEAVTAQSDIYAVGLLLYEMLAGVPPFDGRSPNELFNQHRTQPPPPIRVRAPGVDVAPRLEAVIMRMLQKDPADRFESARAVVAALDSAMPSAALDLGASAPLGRLAGSVAGPSPIETVVPVEQEPQAAVMIPPPPAATPPEPPSKATVDVAGGARGEYVPRLASRSSSSGGPAKIVLVAVGAAAAGVAFAAALLFNQQRSAAPPDGGAPSASVIVPASSVAPTSVAAASATAATAATAATTGATAAATATAAPPDAGADSSSLRAALREASDAKAWRRASGALIDLAKADPAAFTDRSVFTAATAVASNLESGAADAVNPVFEALALNGGSGGVDVLYEVVSTRGRSSLAARAGELLRRKDVIDRATPALRIAVELRDAPCDGKLALLERAKADGDLRAVAVLDILRSEACNPRVGQCCFRRSPEVEDAVRSIRARLRAP